MARISITRKDTQGENAQVSLTDRARLEDDNGIYGNVLKYEVNGIDGTDFYQPVGNRVQIVDLVKDAVWSNNPNTAHEDIPYILIRCYQPRYSSGINNLFSTASSIAQALEEQSIGDIVKTGGLLPNPIANSLIARPVNWVFKLPLLVDTEHSFITQFGYGDESGGGNLFSGLREATINNPEFAQGIPGLSKFGATGSLVGANLFTNIRENLNAIYPAINPANGEKFYTQSNPIGMTYNLELLNTSDYEKSLFHQDILRIFSNVMGMGSLRSKVVGTGPCIFSYEIKTRNDGIYYSPACKIDFSWVGQGNMKEIGGKALSQANVITMELTNFFPPMRLLDTLYFDRGIKLRAIQTSERVLCDTLQRYFDISRGIDLKKFG